MCTYTKISAAKVLLFFEICKREGNFVRFLSLGHLGFKEFLFHYVRTIIPMFALQTRAAHLLLDCPLDTLRCTLTASRSSLGHRSMGKKQRMEGYKQGQKKHKMVINGQKVIWSVIYINFTRLYINFCFAKMLYFSNLCIANINRKIWI